MTDVKEFCLHAFSLFGAGMSEEPDGTITVSVCSALSDLFEGRQTLHLAFDDTQAQSDTDLVTAGSYVVDRLITAVRQRGDCAVISLEPVNGLTPSPAANIRNADIIFQASHRVDSEYLLVLFHVSLISDENEERLYYACVDMNTGTIRDFDHSVLWQARSIDSSKDKQIDDTLLSRAFHTAKSASEQFTKDWAVSVQQSIDRRLASEIQRLNKYYADLYTDAVSKHKNADVRLVHKRSVKLSDTIDRVNHKYDIAKELLQHSPQEPIAKQTANRLKAISKAENRLTLKYILDGAVSTEGEAETKAVNQAAEIASKLEAKTDDPAIRFEKLENLRSAEISALHQKGDMSDASPSKTEAIASMEELQSRFDAEKVKRIGELEDKFLLKAVTKATCASIISYPSTVYDYVAVSGDAKASFSSTCDLITGKVVGPECGVCHEHFSDGVVCSCNRMVCDHCAKPCSSCGKHMCAACSSVTCQVCGQPICDDCCSDCSVCGKTVCTKHATKCACCGVVCCSKHNEVCVVCGERTCRSCMGDAHICVTCANLFPATSSIPALEYILGRPLKRRGTYVAESDGRFVVLENKAHIRTCVIDRSTGVVRTEKVYSIVDSYRIRRAGILR